MSPEDRKCKLIDCVDQKSDGKLGQQLRIVTAPVATIAITAASIFQSALRRASSCLAGLRQAGLKRCPIHE